MSNGMIRPSRPGAVTLPDTPGGVPGMGMRMGAQPGVQPGVGMGMQQMSGADMIRNLLGSQMNAGQAGGYNWARNGNSLYKDDALRSLEVSQENDPESMTYYIERVAAGMQQYIQQVYHRAGPFFEEYKKAKEDFRNTQAGQPCGVRNAFINDIDRQGDFIRIVAIHGAPFFGRYLINILKENRDLTPRDYLEACFLAVRNVLFFELINWLMLSANGKQYALNLPTDLSSRISNLERFKEVASQAYETFGQNSPYANLIFKRPESTRTDYAALYGAGQIDVFTPFESGKEIISTTTPEYDSIMEMVRRNAAEHRGHHVPPQPSRDPYGGAPVIDWNNVRNDFNNLTPQNRKEFDLRRFFHDIGKQNHYFIPESDWQKIKHAFVKHPDMKREETVLHGCFRIVIIDLENDTGWFSTIVRSDNLDMVTVLTDPKKLLPLLEDPQDSKTWEVTPYPAASVVKENTLDIDIETCAKLEKGIPVIAVKDQLVSNSSKELLRMVVGANSRLSTNFTKENATSFNIMAWDTFSCKTPEDKIRIWKDLPFLFKDAELDERPSFYQACRLLNDFFYQQIVDQEVCDFIDQRLTIAVNNWLVNSAGYGAVKGQNMLQVDSVVRDFRELSNYLKEKDPAAHVFLHHQDKCHALTEAVKIFTYNSKAARNDASNTDSPIAKMRDELELVLERTMCVSVLNKRVGPAYMEKNTPIVVKRSRFPEYFELIEESFDTTMGKDDHFDGTDKLIQFSDSEGMWLFSHSILDKNAATLRHISNAQPLVLLAQD